MRICVYCASSRQCDERFHAEARRLGEVLALAGCTIVYGGGAVGSMGALADGALAHAGRVIGVLPHFMAELEWGHEQLSELELVDDMRVRKHQMLTGSSAVVALPGGSGTLEELFEAITLKRLGIYVNPIILVNTRRFFDPFNAMMEHCIAERFMGPWHKDMWTTVDSADSVLAAIDRSPRWTQDDRARAAL